MNVNTGEQLGEAGKVARAASGAMSHDSNDATEVMRAAAGLRERGRDLDAIAMLERAVELRPLDVELANELGRAFEAAGQAGRAAEAYRRAVELRPDSDVLLANLGNALLHAGDLYEAERVCRRAASLNASSPHVRNALGCVHLERGEFQEACDCFREALLIWPDFPAAHANLGTTLLTLGELAEGFAEREWRRKFEPVHRRTGSAWAGEDVFGHTLLIYAEGGFGNIVHFSRYVPILARRGARILLEVPTRLAPFLRQLEGVWKTSTFGQHVPGWDMYCPLMSVPAVLGNILKDIPAGVPYLKADPERVSRWADRIEPISGYKVGIAWRAEQRTRYGRQRSIPLSHFAPLAPIPGVSLISLDPGWDGSAEFPITRLEGIDRDGAFLDTAAVMKHLDLVITCDTSIAHVAGALAVPVWIAERSVPDWRWMLERTNSPWYPTVRLFRQHTPDDWAGVFERMAQELGGAVLNQRRGEP